MPESQPPPTTVAETALALAACGWCVLPLHAPAPGGGCTCAAGPACGDVGKHPRLSGWQAMPTPDAAFIRRWVTAWPDLNLGWRMGDGLLALDIDPDKGGAAWVAAHP